VPNHITLAVLQDRVDEILGEAVVDGEVFEAEGLRLRAQNGRRKCTQKHAEADWTQNPESACTLSHESKGQVFSPPIQPEGRVALRMANGWRNLAMRSSWLYSPRVIFSCHACEYRHLLILNSPGDSCMRRNDKGEILTLNEYTSKGRPSSAAN